jgi:hypothetical protein
MIYWDAGTVSEAPLVMQTWQQHGVQTILVFSRADDHEAAKAFLDQLITQATGPRSPYRGRLLKAAWGGSGVLLDVLPDPTEHRERLILPAAVWDAQTSTFIACSPGWMRSHPPASLESVSCGRASRYRQDRGVQGSCEEV